MCQTSAQFLFIIVKIFGFFFQFPLPGTLAGIQMVFRDVGYSVDLGSGAWAVSSYRIKATPLIKSRV